MAGFPCQGPWTPLHERKTPLNIAIALDEFKQALANESPKVRRDAAFVDNLIEMAKNTPDFDWEKSSPYQSFETRRDLNPKVIMKFIAGYETIDPLDTLNEPEMSDWYERLLKMLPNNAYKLPALYGRLLYFYFDFDFGDYDESELSEVLCLQRQLVEINPTFGNYVYIAKTCKKLRK